MLKNLHIFQANRCGRRATISPASNAKKLRIFQANLRGGRAMISPASNAKKTTFFSFFLDKTASRKMLIPWNWATLAKNIFYIKMTRWYVCIFSFLFSFAKKITHIEKKHANLKTTNISEDRSLKFWFFKWRAAHVLACLWIRRYLSAFFNCLRKTDWICLFIFIAIFLN